MDAEPEIVFTEVPYGVNTTNIIKRINELAKKKKTLGLNAEEQAEQKQLYAVYLAEIREQFDNTLDNVSIKQEDGSVVPFKSAAKKKTKEDNKSE